MFFCLCCVMVAITNEGTAMHMRTARTNQITTDDGVIIGATVHGEGPPLVFLQGIAADGDLDWQQLVPYLSDAFTCHLPSMRGRGLSGDHPDLSIDRVCEDYVTYIDSLGEPTGVVGLSAGAGQALLAAARCDAVAAVAAYEPLISALMDEQEQAALGAALARTAQLAADEDLVAAMRAFAGYPLTDGDMVAAEDAGYFDTTGRYVPNLLAVFQQLVTYDGPMPDDPAVLGAISAPVMVLHGTQTKPIFRDSARFVAAHVPDAQVVEIPGAGHLGPLSHPETIAETLIEFFAPAQQPT